MVWGGVQRGGGDSGVGRRGPERRQRQWCGEEGTVVWGGGDSGMGRREQWYGEEKMHNENITAGAG